MQIETGHKLYSPMKQAGATGKYRRLQVFFDAKTFRLRVLAVAERGDVQVNNKLGRELN
jgi:hypothetical protein